METIDRKKPEIDYGDWCIYLSILILLIIYRCFVLKDFAFKYADSDQAIMWYGLDNYSKGIFNEPRFYGQAYNTMMEAFFAVPLYKIGIPAYKALPIVTSIFAIAPFIIFSAFVFLKKSSKLGLIILSIPLLLPAEYSFMTSMPRGLVTGIFVSSLGLISIFYPKSRYSFLLGGFIAVLGYSINANSVLIAVPYLSYLLLNNYKDKYYYIFLGTGIVLGYITHVIVNHFYITNPYYDFHKAEVDYSFDALINSLTKINIYFNEVTPVFWMSGFMAFILFLVLSYHLFRNKDRKNAFIVLIIPVAIILTLGITKVHDGTDSIYFSCSRMYLSIPLLLGVSISFLNYRQNSKFIYMFLLLPISYFIFHISSIDKAIQKNIDPTKNHVVAVAEVQKILNDCNYMKAICKKHDIQLVLISSHKNQDFYSFGCNACDENFPRTLRPAYERRTWRLLEDEKRVYSNLLIIDSERDLASEFDFIKKADDSGYLFIIEKNKEYIMSLLRHLQMHCREYKKP